MDVGETNNLAEKLPEKTAELEQQLVDFLENVDAETAKTTDKQKQRESYSSSCAIKPSVTQAVAFACDGGLSVGKRSLFPLSYILPLAVHRLYSPDTM